ncbi:YceI family protein [Streptomyces sp. NPDC086554]|uniref:YceI family protein n=1 Tax=Streptomyces sp. NPDC086554 TaxID=3154864 RepID=UPI0034336B43
MSTMINLSELTGDYVIDAARTRIGFVARHTMSTRVRGQFEVFEGGAHLDGDHPSRSGARLTVLASSIQTRNRQRDDMLSGKFLDTDNHPAIIFDATGVAPVDKSNFKVTGDLAVRGVSQQVTLDVELTDGGRGAQGDFRVGFKGSATINRNDWGVNWNAATALMVSPKVTLEFDVTVIRQP